jgi:hypothetical protein
MVNDHPFPRPKYVQAESLMVATPERSPQIIGERQSERSISYSKKVSGIQTCGSEQNQPSRNPQNSAS